MSRDPIGKWVRSGKTKEQETAEALAHRRAAWQLGLAMIWLDDVIDDWTRQVIENEATKQYGKRKGQ